LGFSASHKEQDCSHGRTMLQWSTTARASQPRVSALSGSDGSKCSRWPRFNARGPISYATFIIGCVIQARIPMPRCAPPVTGVMTQQRKQSHDDEKSRHRRIDNDAGCDLRTCICARGRIVHPGLARSDRPLGPATATRLQYFLSGDGDADGR
jgi:hypothetical protein